jgi:hypothetical protein
MKKLTLLLPLLFLWGNAPAHAQPADAEPVPVEMNPEQLEAEGFVPLFNGQDLTGWEKRGGTGQSKVEDGAIVGFGRDIKGNTFLCTEELYGDFLLIFEMKFDSLRGNSGLMFRAYPKGGENGRVTGYQCEHDNRDRSWTAGLYDEARRGWLYPDKKRSEMAAAFTEQGQRLFDEQGWNTIVVRCKGLEVDTWLNGEHRVDFTDEDGEDENGRRYDAPGFFGLQVHSGKACNVRWRNLYLKKLDAE